MNCRNPLCGFCYENYRGRANHKGHRGYRKVPRRQEVVMGDILRKRQATKTDEVASASVGQDSVFSEMPGLWAHISESRYPDGSPRQTSTVTVFVDAGVLKVCLNDRDNGLTAWGAGATLCDALHALEVGLQGDSLSWRSSAGQRGRKRGK